jgi:hypothetical protein
MPVYSPTMLAKGYLCSTRMQSFNGDEVQSVSKAILDLKNPADLGTFKHLLMELWLEEVNQKSTFPITKKEQIIPPFKKFFSRSNCRTIRDKLSEKEVNIEDEFTSNYLKFIETCKVEPIVIKLAIEYELEEILIETLQPPEGQITLSEKHGISMKGQIDCIFRCKEIDYVVDWKSTIENDTNESQKIQLQSYLDIWRILNSQEKTVKGLLISLSDCDEKQRAIFKQVVEFDLSERESLISKIVDTTERTGSWCRHCSKNFLKKEPCKKRSEDLEIQKNTQLLETINETLYFADVEIKISKFRRKSSKLQYFGYGKEYQITFIFPHSFSEEYFAEHDIIRMRGSLSSKGGLRTFKVRKYVLL